MLEAHKNQTRKTDGSPYIFHPQAVADKLSKLGCKEEIIAAALLHDVLEDTDFGAEKLRQELGEEVYKIVLALSEDKNLEWEERKQKYINTIAASSEDVKFVSIADKIHNLESLINIHKSMGADIWKKFNRGKEKKMWFENELLHVFKKTWDHPLVKEYENLIKQAKKLA